MTIDGERHLGVGVDGTDYRAVAVAIDDDIVVAVVPASQVDVEVRFGCECRDAMSGNATAIKDSAEAQGRRRPRIALSATARILQFRGEPNGSYKGEGSEGTYNVCGRPGTTVIDVWRADRHNREFSRFKEFAVQIPHAACSTKVGAGIDYHREIGEAFTAASPGWQGDAAEGLSHPADRRKHRPRWRLLRCPLFGPCHRTDRERDR